MFTTARHDWLVNPDSPLSETGWPECAVVGRYLANLASVVVGSGELFKPRFLQ
jgi:hypothetical protein